MALPLANRTAIVNALGQLGDPIVRAPFDVDSQPGISVNLVTIYDPAPLPKTTILSALNVTFNRVAQHPIARKALKVHSSPSYNLTLTRTLTLPLTVLVTLTLALIGANVYSLP